MKTSSAIRQSSGLEMQTNGSDGEAEEEESEDDDEGFLFVGGELEPGPQ